MTGCPGGYTCRIALVDLSRRAWEPVEVDPEAYKYFPGGRSLGVALLYNALNLDEDPFIIATSPLVATGFPMANRLTLTFKSPLTGTVAWANTGGYVSPALKKAGFDAVVIVGVSREPSYILVSDGTVSIEDAGWLWGLDAVETTLELRRRHGDVRVLAVGPAGERGVRYATVINDTGRSSGVRHGAGFVLGKKKIKAIVVAGGRSKPRISDKPRLLTIARIVHVKLRESRLLNREKGLLAVHGTPIALDALAPAEAVPHRNYKTPVVRGWEALSARAMEEAILAGRLTCSACPVSCRRDTTGARLSFRTEGPDYAQISSLGTNASLMDVEGVAYLTSLCYRLGIDPIEAGNLLAMYAEITELEGLGGEGLAWGDLEGMERLIVDITYLRGAGKVLAQGARELARKYGRPEVATDVKGITVQNADPRVEKAWGLANAVESFGGAVHIWVYGDIIASFKSLGVPVRVDWSFKPGESARAVYERQLLVASVDSLQVCAFSTYALTWNEYSAALSAITGTAWSPSSLRGSSRLTLDLERLVNEELGVGPREDQLPPRLSEEPVPEGRNKGSILDLEPYLQAYYEARGLPGGRLDRDRAVEVATKARIAKIT
ncbi:MAG: aldehyde ferredoxin oxidoreductase family protein [Desulfurococcales archaeon]|nr:aldehyde ferredoxin oxidoreductase family protein [Desulfurococcales archaeon]